VLAAGHDRSPVGQAALETLCRAYWYPLYAYVRRQGHSPEDAQDLTQDFFTRFLEHNYFKLANPARGRFRTFLLTALKHFLANEWRKAHCAKRGRGQTAISLDATEAEQRFVAKPVEQSSPEILYERRWAATLLERVLETLREEYVTADKGWQFEELKGGLWGGSSVATYADIAVRRGTTEPAIKTAAHRLRQRYRELLRAEIAHTVEGPHEVDEELRHLATVISG
jgi:RNA polymerase sigma-70 factor (ECF subfamily)